MGDGSKIEWTEATWNPVRGCSIVSPGCERCYAMNVAARFSGKGQPYEGLAKFSTKKRLPQWTGKVRLVPEHLGDPIRWTRPRRVFVNSMSDLFHEGLTNEQIAAVFGVMAASPRHTFQILTKRAVRMRRWFDWVGNDRTKLVAALWPYQKAGHVPSAFFREGEPVFWPLPNVWMGVSVEDQPHAQERIPELLSTPAAVRFVSYEPALGPVGFAPFLPPKLGTCAERDSGRCTHSLANDRAALDWIIVGGESGPKARLFEVGWAGSVVEQCRRSGVACFVKQLGSKPLDDGTPRKLKDPKGGDWSEWPMSIRVRQYPGAGA